MEAATRTAPAEVEINPYDNEVTLLYKWAEVFGLPVQLIIVRPRTPQDADIVSGTDTLVYESLVGMVERLSAAGETPADVYDIIYNFNKYITVDDIAMAYAILAWRADPQRVIVQEINRVYNSIDENVMEKFESQQDLNVFYNSWYKNFDARLNHDLQRLNSILDIQDALAEVDEEEEKIQFSPPVLNSTIMSFSPQIGGRRVLPDDGIDIFNAAIVSQYVPYIQYNDSYGKSVHKVYTGEKIENTPQYGITVIPSADASAKNTIYMTLWLGDPNNNGSVGISKAPRDSFSTVIYHLDSNYLTVKTPIRVDTKKGLIRDENIAFQRTQNALPSIQLGAGTETKVSGEFKIWSTEYDESSLLHIILNDNVMNVYLYVEENITPFALKKRLDIHYRSIFSDEEEGKKATGEAYISNSASVSITLNQKTSTAEEDIEVYDPRTGQITTSTMPPNSPYIQVNISQAESRRTLDNFIPIFQLLMGYYMRNKDEIMALYFGSQGYDDNGNPIQIQGFLERELPALPALLAAQGQKPERKQTTITALTKKQTTNQRENAKIQHLREKIPDLFIGDYPRKCQCSLQPIIVDQEQAAAWRQRRVGPSMVERQIMPFPKDNPRFNFVCPSDSEPYPGVKLNTTLPNRDKYPYIPCCFKKDQMTPGVNSHYRDYVENRPPELTKGAKAEKPISTNKILSPSTIGYLPRAIERTVQRYSDEHIEMVRYGVIYSTNSILHCICVAIDDPNYIALNTVPARENYVTRIRQHILGTVLPGLMKQEMYDHTDAEIMTLLGDNGTFLDPSLFYRAVEETFQVNIYVFTDSSTKQGLEERGEMDIPRFHIFHSRPLRLDRPTAVLLKTMGSESDVLEHAHCELIVDYDVENKQVMKLFGPAMTEICHTTLQETIRTITWEPQANNELDAQANIYYYIDHLSLFQVPGVSQYIDKNGKMRALTVQLPDRQMTIATIPSQPENLPVTTNFVPVPAEIALAMLGQPNSVTRDTQGQVDGMWFSILSIANGEYVPIVPTPGYDDLPLGPPNPLISRGTNVTARLSKLKRTLDIIREIVRWLYELTKMTGNVTPEYFAQNYLIMNTEPVEDSAEYYDLSNIPRQFPAVGTPEDGIAQLEPLAPTLFNGGRIVMYSPEFADRIIKMLRDYNNLILGKIPDPPTHIANYYSKATDFTPYPNTNIFINRRELDSWLKSLSTTQNYERNFSIRNRIEPAMSAIEYPFFYEDVDGKIYLIQNVLGGSISKAVAVASTWRQLRVNIGFTNPIPAEVLNNYMLYGLSPSSNLIPIEDHTGGQDDFLRILYYGSSEDKALGRESRYAAILEML